MPTTLVRSARVPLIASLLCVAIGGCLPGGLLITPASTRRDLRETTIMRDNLLALDKIVVIDVSGMLLNSPSPKLFGSGEHQVSRLLEQLDKARGDRHVKAVILRINSPGGTVTASQLMHDEIAHFRTCGKPIVAVMMDVAASGGYYIACACDEIVAQPTTVTGSIGVIMQLFDVSGTMKLIGVTGNTMASGPRKGGGSPFAPLTREDRAIFQSIVDELYAQFLDVVEQGRPALDRQTIETLADGRVYTARQALEAGLVDRIATMRETISALKEQLNLDNIRVTRYRRPLDYRPNYYAHTPEPGAGDINLLKVEGLTAWPSPAPRFLYVWSPGQ